MALSRARASVVLCSSGGSPSPFVEEARLDLGASWADKEEELFGPAETLQSTYRLLRDELLDQTVRTGGRLGDVADQRCDFDLFANRNAKIILLLPIEIHEHDVAQGSNRGELGCRDRLAFGEGLQSAHHLLTCVEYDGERSLPVALMQKLVFHVIHPPAAASLLL